MTVVFPFHPCICREFQLRTAQENEKNSQKYLSQISELQQLLDQSEVVRRELDLQVCERMHKYVRRAHEAAPHVSESLRASVTRMHVHNA